ncbi:DUF3928 family protein [Ectobacillus ponti]|uniref:DUF3928 family protein n=1 Tax=Ectobacillus ponti TaxID=2961894 RepID=A0AA41X8G0_9BACI|nr:DUF3928 family protein [Ectobacillus ponti]MCP8970829.1 DUF3928 family protein [Ectobacillus ponti]
MYTFKIISGREAVYQFASYIRCIPGVEDVRVEDAHTSYERGWKKFFVRIALQAAGEEKEALREIARLLELSRFTYVHYNDAAIEQAFEDVKYESFAH